MPRMINAALRRGPADMTITMHFAAGTSARPGFRPGGYEPVADMLLIEVNDDGYFLEYDSDRAGGFEPLRYVPNGNRSCSAL